MAAGTAFLWSGGKDGARLQRGAAPGLTEGAVSYTSASERIAHQVSTTKPRAWMLSTKADE